MTYIDLFITFMKIAAISFGGGYAMLPMISHEVVEIHGWITAIEFKNLIVVSQMIPGAIAINAATFSGVKTAGVLGAIVAISGVITTSAILVITILKHLESFKHSPLMAHIMRGIRPSVVALIAFAAYGIGDGGFTGVKSWVFFFVVGGLHYFKRWPAHWLILLSAVAGYFWI